MHIYVGNLPGTLSIKELQKVLRSAIMPNNPLELLRRLFSKSEKLNHSEINLIHVDGKQSCCAHAIIIPDSVAKRAIERITQTQYQGKSLQAREFVIRNPNNDRRKNRRKNLYAVKTYDRRKGERRRH